MFLQKFEFFNESDILTSSYWAIVILDFLEMYKNNVRN